MAPSAMLYALSDLRIARCHLLSDFADPLNEIGVLAVQMPGSLGAEAAVGHDLGARDIRGFVRGQKEGHVGDLAWVGDSP